MPGQADHVVCKIKDANRIAHVQQKDFAAAGQTTGLDHQLHSLVNGHEVACHLSVGHGHRAAQGNLFPEQRDHGT